MSVNKAVQYTCNPSISHWWLFDLLTNIGNMLTAASVILFVKQQDISYTTFSFGLWWNYLIILGLQQGIGQEGPDPTWVSGYATPNFITAVPSFILAYYAIFMIKWHSVIIMTTTRSTVWVICTLLVIIGAWIGSYQYQLASLEQCFYGVLAGFISGLLYGYLLYTIVRSGFLQWWAEYKFDPQETSLLVRALGAIVYFGIWVVKLVYRPNDVEGILKIAPRQHYMPTVPGLVIVRHIQEKRADPLQVAAFSHPYAAFGLD